MLGWKLFARFDKNPEIVHSFDFNRYNHPFFPEFFEIYLEDVFLKKNICDECYRL